MAWYEHHLGASGANKFRMNNKAQMNEHDDEEEELMRMNIHLRGEKRR